MSERQDEGFRPAPVKPPVAFDALGRIDIRVGRVESVEDVAGSDKLVKLTVNFGDHRRSILDHKRHNEGQGGCYLGLPTVVEALPRHLDRTTNPAA